MLTNLPALIIMTIWSTAFLLSTLPIALAMQSGSLLLIIFALATAPNLFILAFVTTAGLVSRIATSSIKPGSAPRDLKNKVYGWRRIYGTCWTQLYYFKPIYSVALSIPFLKRYMFWLFGYKGPSTQFVVYPDTWLRDLPVLNISESAYLANRSTIGTNICMADNTIFVDRIKIGQHSLVGHLAVLGPGCVLEDGCEVGVGTSIGIRAVIKEKVSIKPNCCIYHGTVIASGCDIGARSYIGSRVKIAKDLKIPAGANIPAGAVLNTQEEVDKYSHSESKNLTTLFNEKMNHHFGKQNGN
jgi:carbonic anhydrase/acetyltransferase-like protein (isoleucine patch superfamily)